MTREPEIPAVPTASRPSSAPADPRPTLAWDPRALLACAPREFLRRMPDRETFAWPESSSADDVPRPRSIVKRTRGSPAREDWYERLRGLAVRSPGQREHDNLRGLAADGLAVPRAIAWCEGPAGDGSREACSVVAMELVEHAETLRDAVARADAGERARVATDLLELVVRLHEHGWYHRDLYLQHVLVRSGERRELVLIDVGRARKERAPRVRWFVKDLAALLHSTPPSVSGFERLRFFAGYLDRRGIRARGERRWWLRAVLNKAARMASHVPRFGERRAEESQGEDPPHGSERHP